MGLYSTALLLLLLYVCFLLSLISSSSPVEINELKEIDAEKPAIDVIPVARTEDPSSKSAILCERIRVSGISRLNIGSYSNAYRVSLFPSVAIPERLHSKILICIHKNASLGLCQCETSEWRTLHKGSWSTFMSPYEDRYVDVKFTSEFSGSVTLTLEDEFQRWRLFCLALGFILLLASPIISHWVPFYYSSSMAIGICLVIIILLFQGMKLLPTGRKNFFYLTIYGSVLGAGSFLLHHFSLFVNSILVNFGLGEELHNPVSVFILIGIILAGAGLGYWIVRKYVVSEDGRVDVGVAQFVKWSMRIVAVTFIFQSTLDTPLAVALLTFCLAISFAVSSMKWPRTNNPSHIRNGNLWVHRDGRTNLKHKNAEFYSRSGKMGPRGSLWDSPKSSSQWSDSPVKGLMSPSNHPWTRNVKEYYSTFHKTPRKKFTRHEWEDFTQESTRQAVSELTSSPEFTDWIINGADRIQVHQQDDSDGTIGSGSDSTDENAAESSNGIGLFKWSSCR